MKKKPFLNGKNESDISFSIRFRMRPPQEVDLASLLVCSACFDLLDISDELRSQIGSVVLPC